MMTLSPSSNRSRLGLVGYCDCRLMLRRSAVLPSLLTTKTEVPPGIVDMPHRQDQPKTRDRQRNIDIKALPDSSSLDVCQ